MAPGGMTVYDPNNYDRIVKDKITCKYHLQQKKWYGVWKFRMVQSNSCGWEAEYSDTYELLEFDDLEEAKRELKKFQDERREVRYNKHYVVVKT